MRLFQPLAALGLASISVAQLVTSNPTDQDDISYSVNVPSDSASSGSGDIYFQIKASTSFQWVALGQGSQMANSNIFVIYSSSDGKNVTLSPRLGTGHEMPQYDSSAQVSLLDGSGISGGIMTANVRCGSCSSWSGGSMSLTDSSSSWIWAYKSGSALDSDSSSESISLHSSASAFSLDLTQGTGGSSTNPFTTSSSTSSSSGSASSSSSSSYFGGSGGNSNPGSTFPASESSFGSFFSKRTAVLTAHAVVMCLAFVLFFPLGGMLIRVFSFPGLIWVHAFTQVFAWCLSIAGMGLGIYLAKNERQLTHHHAIIGLVVVSVLSLQPLLGLVHHEIYKRTGTRTLYARIHVWLGRSLILLGIINGGLGLQLSSNSRKGEIAYGVLAAIIGITYIIVVTCMSAKRRSAAATKAGSPGGTVLEKTRRRGSHRNGSRRGSYTEREYRRERGSDRGLREYYGERSSRSISASRSSGRRGSGHVSV
ncbi:MAG: hypothetical protein M1834_004014 [Cirrosporium novae-zelandiae]|nr:MAG: hypothetical protein M1834_004014 [Cirrosporium novae-zelandiae]